MRFLRSNTAVIITVGPFYDKTDGVTIKTALTITNERITLTADTDAGSAPTNILDNVTGATSGTSNDLNYITGNDAGLMQMELAAADVNRVGRMFLSITDAANHVPVFHELFVLPQAIFDWITGAIIPLPANVTQLLGTAWLTPGTAGTPDVNVKLWNALTTVALPLIPTTAGRTLDVATTGEAGLDFDNIKDATGAHTLTNIRIPVTTLTDTVTTYTGNTVQTGDSFARIGVAGAGLTNIDLPNQTMDIVGNITGNLSGSVGSVTGAVGSVTGLTAATVHSDLDDIQTRLPAALTSDGNIKADSLRISGSAESADRLERSTLAIVTATCAALGTTTSIIASAVSPTSGTNDQFKGRIITFDKDTTTTNLRGQATDITAYTHATLTFTVTALTTAPVVGDTFTVT